MKTSQSGFLLRITFHSRFPQIVLVFQVMSYVAFHALRETMNFVGFFFGDAWTIAVNHVVIIAICVVCDVVHCLLGEKLNVGVSLHQIYIPTCVFFLYFHFSIIFSVSCSRYLWTFAIQLPLSIIILFQLMVIYTHAANRNNVQNTFLVFFFIVVLFLPVCKYVCVCVCGRQRRCNVKLAISWTFNF